MNTTRIKNSVVEAANACLAYYTGIHLSPSQKAAIYEILSEASVECGEDYLAIVAHNEAQLAEQAGDDN